MTQLFTVKFLAEIEGCSVQELLNVLRGPRPEQRPLYDGAKGVGQVHDLSTLALMACAYRLRKFLSPAQREMLLALTADRQFREWLIDIVETPPGAAIYVVVPLAHPDQVGYAYQPPADALNINVQAVLMEILRHARHATPDAEAEGQFLG